MGHEHTDEHVGRATIGDVAEQAGVSVATVSRALRGLPNVARTTRRRIELVADELNYRPDPAAARLAAGHTNTITVGIPALDSWYFSNVVAGVESACRAGGYEVQVVCLVSHHDVNRLLDPEGRLERRTDGLILVDIDLDPAMAADLRARGVSVGTIGFHIPGCPAVQIDDVGVGRLAAEHLIDIGCQRPAIIAGIPDDPVRHRVPDLRRSGFQTVLESFGRSLGGRIAAAEFSVAGGRAAMAALLTGRTATDRPDGVFAMSDEMAFGALMELRSRHVRVGRGPDSIAVLGVDDHEFAQVADLTTVHQQVAEHGAQLAHRLIDSMDHERRSAPSESHTTQPLPEIHRPDVSLVERASTAPTALSESTPRRGTTPD